jgi:hypothetical protein
MSDFDPDTYLATPVSSGFDPDAYLAKKPDSKADAEPADHGLSERQKLTPIGKALSPIASYPETYSRMNHEARDQMSRGVDQISNSGSLTDPAAYGMSDVLNGAGNIALGGLSYVTSPINSAYRSIAGQPIEDVTGIPREYTEFAGQLATPGIGLTGAVKAPAAVFDAPFVKAPIAGNDVVSAAARASEVAPAPINVPRAFASDSTLVQRAGQLARNVPMVGDSIPRATGEMVDQMGNTVKSIASNYGEGSGPNVANKIGRTIQSAAEKESEAASSAARQSDEALSSAWQRDTDAAHASIANREAQTARDAQEAVGSVSPQDMGSTLINRLRASEHEAQATKNDLYARAGESDASVRADSVQGVHNRVSTALDDAGRVVDAELTPAANRMMGELRNFSDLQIPNRVGPSAPNPADIAAVDARGMEQVRKRLGSMSQAANNDADRAASRLIMRQFDDWQSDAFDNALFSGSPEALQVARDARAANTSWRQRFYNDRDDADKLINKVVTGEVTPQEFSNWLVGASQVGAKGVSSRLLTRVSEAVNSDPEAMQAIRGGIWNRLSQATEGATSKAPEKVASGIHEFLNGSGRDIAQRMFAPEQQATMRAYADTLRRSAEARDFVATVSKNTKPTPMQVGPGPMQELASATLGKSGKSDEALFSAIDAYARSGARGDVRTLADIVKSVPETDKGNLAGAIIRKMGESKTTNEFSPDVFASEWSKYTPQAKAVLFGNAGSHVRALDDLATISQRYKDVGRRFGNPSGTSQNVAGLGLVTSLYAAPLPTLAGIIGGTIAARVLSAPVSATKTATWAKTYNALSKGQTVERLAAYQAASNGLAVIARKLGADVNLSNFMAPVQGAIPTRADDKQR